MTKKFQIGVLLILLLGAACNKTNQSTPSTQTKAPADPNQGHTLVHDQNGYHGTAILTGYLTIITSVCEPGGMCGQTVQKALFNYTKSSDDNVRHFLDQSFEKSAVVLGCYEKNKNRIYYENAADSGWYQGQITGNDLKLLLNSDKGHQVNLTLDREIYSGGKDAPDCYSNFRNFKVSPGQ